MKKFLINLYDSEKEYKEHEGLRVFVIFAIAYLLFWVLGC